MLRSNNRNPFCNCARVPLALVAMVMSMKDRLNLADANLGEEVQNMSGPEINQDGVITVLQNINVAGVRQHVKVGRNLCQPAFRCEFDSRGSGESFLLARGSTCQLSRHEPSA